MPEMNNYTKVRLIGSGSFGTVWLIRSKSNQRNYVLKEIPLCTVQEKEREFILNEVQVLSRLRHKNIIRYKEAFLNNGLLCISMEFAHEGDLSHKIQKQCGRMFPKEQVIDWFIQLCLSVKYIHGMNILHRDIKLQNIFLAKGNVIKLGDFGIARVLHNTLDHAQTVIGTPYYLSPEICQRQLYNHKSDIWAMGCVLYEMITLTHPFEATDFAGLVVKILHADYTPIAESHGPLLRDLVTVVLRLKPTERPSAKQILHIPAMQPYVDKVLARGRTQRSESVSYGAKELFEERDVWRKPDVMPPEKVSCVPDQVEVTPVEKRRCVGLENDCKKARCKEVLVNQQQDKMREVERPSCEDACIGTESDSTMRNGRNERQRKRVSSEVFSSDNECNAISEEKACKTNYKARFCAGEVLEDDKENPYSFEVQRGYSKNRAYSTSIVRESVERKPLIPLNKHAVPLGETYEVVPCSRQIRKETFTIFKKPTHAVGKKQTFTAVKKADIHRAGSETETNESKQKQFKKKNPELNERKRRDFIEILLTRNRFKFGNISPEDSMGSYIQAMRLYLEETLGAEMFIAAYRYLSSDVQKDEYTIDVTSKLFEIMGDEHIIYVPLVLQLIQCENSFS